MSTKGGELMRRREPGPRRAVPLAHLALSALLSACSADVRVFGPGENRRPVVPSTPGKSHAAGPAAAVGGGPSPPPVAITIDHTGRDNPAKLAPEEVAQLMAGGPVGTARWLYPYDGTVFPRGTVSPLVMWHSDLPPDAVFLHVRSQRFDYKGILRPEIGGSLFMPANALASSSLSVVHSFGGQETQTQLAIPQVVWDLAGQQSLGAADPFTLELTQRANGVIQGPLRASILIARAAIKGSLYYNTCASTLAVPDIASGGLGGKVLRIPFGGNAEVLSVSEGRACIGCHTISADGSHALAQRSVTTSDVPGGALPTMPVTYALSYQLDRDGESEPGSTTPIAPAPVGMQGPVGAYGALYPDGSKFLSTSAQVPLVWAPNALATATLYDSKTGVVTGDTQIPPSAAMPMFSPDGRYLVFNDATVDGARALAIMRYDTRTNRASDYRVLVREPAGSALRPGWPVFLPDNKAVVFVRTTDPYFSGNSQGGLAGTTTAAINGRIPKAAQPSDLYIADVASGRVTLLAKAMGFRSPADAEHEDATYLPFAEEDLHYNFYPTVSPVAAGGYFWVFFDSFRHFGSLGALRLLWAAAIDVRADGNYALDPSHPPFYVAGQEFSASTRFRAFAALDLCAPEAAACQTGIDCCTGVCSLPGNGGVELTQAMGTCSPALRACARRDERCSADADCCDSSLYCINTFCAQVELL